MANDKSVILDNYLMFTYTTSTFGLERKDKNLTDMLNEDGEAVKAVHKAFTDLTAGDESFRAVRKVRQNFINWVNANTIHFGTGKLVSMDSAFFGSFKDKIEEFQKQFYEAVRVALPDEQAYEDMIEKAKENTKYFDRGMYPTFDLAKASYVMEFDFVPINTKINKPYFKIEKEYMDYLNEQSKLNTEKKLKECESQIRDRLAVAMKDVIKTVEDVIKVDDDGQKHAKAKGFKRAKIEKLVQLPNILRSLNITGDESIREVINEFEEAIAPFRVGLEKCTGAEFPNIKNNPQTRATIRSDVKKVLDKLPF